VELEEQLPSFYIPFVGDIYQRTLTPCLDLEAGCDFNRLLGALIRIDVINDGYAIGSTVLEPQRNSGEWLAMLSNLFTREFFLPKVTAFGMF